MKFMKAYKLVFILPAFFLFSCVSSKRMKAVENKYGQLDSAYLAKQSELRDCQSKSNDNNRKYSELNNKNSALEKQIDDLNKQVAYLKDNNNSVINQLSSLSVISKSQAQSIAKSLDNLQSKDMYINNLRSSLAHKDSLNLALIMNLKSALTDINDKDIDIKVEKGVVYINISDKLLFKSGSYNVNENAQTVLGKVAKVLNAHKEIEFMVEGYTDSNRYSNGLLLDNWDLSSKRATSVARILMNTYQIDPKRMTVAGHGEYQPVASNSSEEGRSANRRTSIVILPQLDQFFKLLETNK